ncbi:MAG TPA: glycosyltransferase, partial [Lapillicoccus sp.]
MTTTLAPPHAALPADPGVVTVSNRRAAPRVTAVLVVRGDALGSPGTGEPDAGLPAAPARTVARLPEVLDAVAAQTRPPERLVVVAVEDPDVTPSIGTRVDGLVAAHDGLAATIPEVLVLGIEAPAAVGKVIDAALAELDRRHAPGEAIAEPPAEPDAADQPDSPGSGADFAAAEGDVEPEPARAHTSKPDSTPPAAASTPTLTGPEWIWILDDTVAPTPTALLRLVEAVRRSRSVGIAGPKVVRWENPRLFVELGRQVTRTGRRLDAPAFGEADQGQYDTRTDVLAVGTAGMLVRREVYEQLGGFEPAFASAGADLDLGWRAQLAGQRVVVVPAAVVRRARTTAERQAGPLATRLAERRAARRVALTRCSPLAVPFLAVWIVVGGVMSALGLLLLKRPQHAWAELSDIGALGRPFASAAARSRFRRIKKVRRRHLTGLFVGSGEALGASWD